MVSRALLNGWPLVPSAYVGVPAVDPGPGPDPDPDPEPVDQWYTPNAYADYDGTRVYLDGTEYATVADAVTAGAVTMISGGGFRFPVPQGMTQFSARTAGVTSAAANGGTIEMILSADDGTASNGFYIARHSVNKMRTSVTTAGTTVATLDPTPGSTPNMPFNSGMRIKANDFFACVNADNGKSDTAGAMPTLTHFCIGNRYDGLRPWNGTIRRVVIFTQRELSGPECEIMSGINQLKAMVWSWWNKPQAITRAGKTYFAGMCWRDKTGSNAAQYAIQMDQAGYVEDCFKLTANEYLFDEHSTGALEFLPDGRAMVEYNGHGEDGITRFRISNSNQIGGLGPEVQISALADTSYTQLHIDGSDIYAVMQGGDNKYWDIYKSTNAGGAWTRLKRIFQGKSTGGNGINQWYLTPSRIDANGNILYFVQQHSSNAQNQLGSFRLNVRSGDVTLNNGTVLGNIYDTGNLDVEIADNLEMNIVRTAAAGRSQRLMNVKEDGSGVLIVDFGNADYSTPTHMAGLLSAGTFTFNNIVSAGQSFSPTNNASYFPGSDWAKEPHSGHRVYLNRYDTGSSTWKLSRYDSADGVTWTETLLKDNGTKKLLRTVCPRDAEADGIKVLYSDATTYNDFNDLQGDTYAVA